jgi:hypothetical protein
LLPGVYLTASVMKTLPVQFPSVKGICSSGETRKYSTDMPTAGDLATFAGNSLESARLTPRVLEKISPKRFKNVIQYVSDGSRFA